MVLSNKSIQIKLNQLIPLRFLITFYEQYLDIFQSLDHLTAFFGVGAFDAEAQNFALRKVVRKQLGFCDRHVVYRTPLVGLPRSRNYRLDQRSNPRVKSKIKIKGQEHRSNQRSKSKVKTIGQDVELRLK